MKEQLVKFIQENDLEFPNSGSGLNGACTVICGYADHLGAKRVDVERAILVARDIPGEVALPSSVYKEVKRVHDFAKTYQYSKWWTENKSAKLLYKF
jgi:hypothetical protein